MLRRNLIVACIASKGQWFDVWPNAVSTSLKFRKILISIDFYSTAKIWGPLRIWEKQAYNFHVPHLSRLSVGIQIRRCFRLIYIFMRPVLPLSDLLVGHIWIIERSRFLDRRIHVFLLLNHKSMTAVERFSNIIIFSDFSFKIKSAFDAFIFDQLDFLEKQCHILCRFFFSRTFN